MTIISRFAGTCTVCRARFAAGTQIEWTKGAGARHIQCPQVPQEMHAEPPVVLPVASIVGFLRAARERGLKFPKARFLAPGNEEMRLSLAGAKARVPGAVQVVVRGQWVGRVNPDGEVVGLLKDDPQLQDLLRRIADDPAGHAKAYGALMARCSFCDKDLTDAGSVEAGYGPVCAKHWGLPHKALGTPHIGGQ